MVRASTFSGCATNHAAYNVQRTTCSVQHAAYNMQRTTCSVQHAAYNMQRATCSVQHAACSMQHAAWSSRFLRCQSGTLLRKDGLRQSGGPHGGGERACRVGYLSWQGSPCRAGNGCARPCCAVRRLRSALWEALWLGAVPQVLHQTGRGCRHDLEAAAAWYRLAVQHGHVPAMVRHVAGPGASPPDSAGYRCHCRAYSEYRRRGARSLGSWRFDGAVCARMCVYARIWGLCEHAHMHARRRFM
jgi:hypothetical protein